MAEEEYERKLDSLRQDITELRSGLKGLLEDLKDISIHEGEDKMARAKQQLNQGVEWVKDAVDTIRSSGQKTIDNISHRVERRPVASVLTAFGAGLLLGRLFMRR